MRAELPKVVDNPDLRTKAVRAHVADCLACQKELIEYKKLLHALHSLRDELDPAPGTLSGILSDLEQKGERSAIRALLRSASAEDADPAAVMTAGQGVIGIAADLLESADDLVVAFVRERARVDWSDSRGDRHRVVPADELYRLIHRSLAHSTRAARAVLQLEELLDAPDPAEHELQSLMEEWPELLLGVDYVEAYPQVVLETGTGRLIPDFVLQPVTGGPCDLVEIKLPSVTLLTRRNARPQLTREVAAGISQLRAYSEAIADPAVRERALLQYGISLYRPRLELVIGRSKGVDLADLRRAGDERVRLRTWDDLLARAHTLFR